MPRISRCPLMPSCPAVGRRHQISERAAGHSGKSVSSSVSRSTSFFLPRLVNSSSSGTVSIKPERFASVRTMQNVRAIPFFVVAARGAFVLNWTSPTSQSSMSGPRISSTQRPPPRGEDVRVKVAPMLVHRVLHHCPPLLSPSENMGSVGFEHRIGDIPETGSGVGSPVDCRLTFGLKASNDVFGLALEFAARGNSNASPVRPVKPVIPNLPRPAVGLFYSSLEKVIPRHRSAPVLILCTGMKFRPFAYVAVYRMAQ